MVMFHFAFSIIRFAVYLRNYSSLTNEMTNERNFQMCRKYASQDVAWMHYGTERVRQRARESVPNS